MEPSTRPASDGFVLKFDDAFIVLDEFGDTRSDLYPDQGLFLNDCRHLSRLQLRIGAVAPLALAANLSQDGALLTVDLSNSDVYGIGDQQPLVKETIHVSRQLFLWNNTLHQRLKIRTFARSPQLLVLQHVFDADFSDIFEVRGTHREHRGTREPSKIEDGSVLYGYKGQDDIYRSTLISFDPIPDQVAPSTALHQLALVPGEEYVVDMQVVAFQSESGQKTPQRETKALRRHYRDMRRHQRREYANTPRIVSSNELFNGWLNRSVGDLHMLLSATKHGIYPYAGTPWFNTAFGRDGIITALQALAFEPRIAAGVLRFLAANQADVIDAWSDATPGKILHETRRGEMARLRQVPFAAYYGSIDATPLFVMLAGAYLQRTADLELVREIWPNVQRALKWIEDSGDADNDGFVEYQREAETGLRNQGWKDSEDAISHENGEIATGPIALCEVQGYVYAAKSAAASIAQALGESELGESLLRDCKTLAQRFDEAFWDPDLGTYVLALDGSKRPCRVVASNAGHTLITRIVKRDRADAIVQSLMSESMYSGWGVRTLSSGEAQFSPLSYHNGSVWPHDNGLIALGMASYGYRREPLRIMTGLFEASLCMPLNRLPELFCGFAKRRTGSPVAYAESCAPQAWASAAAYGLLTATLGISVDAPNRQLRIERPTLPSYIRRLRVTNLQVGDSMLDLAFEFSSKGAASVVPSNFRGHVELVIAP